MPSLPSTLPLPQGKGKGVTTYFENKISAAEHLINAKTQNLRRLEAQRNALNARVRLLREELQLLQEPGSYVGEVVKVMGQKKVLVKVQPEGKYGAPPPHFLLSLSRPLISLTHDRTQSSTLPATSTSASSRPTSASPSAPTLVRTSVPPARSLAPPC